MFSFKFPLPPNRNWKGFFSLLLLIFLLVPDTPGSSRKKKKNGRVLLTCRYLKVLLYFLQDSLLKWWFVLWCCALLDPEGPAHLEMGTGSSNNIMLHWINNTLKNKPTNLILEHTKIPIYFLGWWKSLGTEIGNLVWNLIPPLNLGEDLNFIWN